VTAPTGSALGVVSQADLLAVSFHEGTATPTGAVGRYSTAEIVTRVVTAVPGVTKVVNRIRYDFDDEELVRSTVSRTHRAGLAAMSLMRHRPCGTRALEAS
jgi:hypothetical protein